MHRKPCNINLTCGFGLLSDREVAAFPEPVTEAGGQSRITGYRAVSMGQGSDGVQQAVFGVGRTHQAEGNRQNCHQQQPQQAVDPRVLGTGVSDKLSEFLHR